MVIQGLKKMSDLIRGGQVTFHKFRMLMQVTKVLSRMGVILFLLSIGYSYYANITKKEWQVGAAWVKSDVIMLFKEDYLIKYPSKYGIERTVKVKDMALDPYVLVTINKFETALYKGLYIALIMFVTVLGGLLLFFWLRGRKIKKSVNIRGIFLISARKLRKVIVKHNQLIKAYKPFKIADFSYPVTGRSVSWTAGEQSHTLILGSTGTGKTKIIQQQVFELYQRNQKAIIVDVKGDYIKNFYRKQRGDIILNPLDVRGANWSIFNETNPLKGFSTIAKSLLPSISKNDPIWTDAARGVLAEMANLYVTEGLSMSEFADKLLKLDLKTLVKLLEKTSASKLISSDLEKAALSVLMVLSTYLRPLKLYRSSENCFSITDWINDNSKRNFLFISSRADVKEDINPLISTQVDIAINALRGLKDESSTPKIWFILDELPYFEQPIPSLKDGLATVRSFGGCFVLGTQDMSSLAKIYSDKTAEAIANNCKTKIFMNLEGIEAAEWGSQSLGEGEIEEWHEGLSYGSHEMRDGIQVSRNKIIKRAVLASELMMLKAGNGYIKFAGFEPAKFKFDNCYFKKIAESYEENTELLNLFKKELEEGEIRRREIEMKLLDKNSTPEINKNTFDKTIVTERNTEEEKEMEEPNIAGEW